MNDYLIDENLPRGLFKSERLVREINGCESDLGIWKYAKANGLVVVTKDTDFYDRMLINGPPPKVVWIRVGNLSRAGLRNLMNAQRNEIEKLLNEFPIVKVRSDRLTGIEF